MTAIAELGTVACIFNGKTPSKQQQRYQGFPVLKIKDIDEFGQFRGQIDSFVDTEFAHAFIEKIVREGDILLLNAAHNASYVASKRFFAVGSAVGALATGEWTIIRAKSDYIDPRFLFFWLEMPSTKKAIGDLVRGIHLYPTDVAGLAIPLPPLAEQQRIAHRLENADQLRRMRRYAVQMCDDLLPSTFRELFGAPDNSWPIVTIEELAANKPNAIRTGPFGSQLLHSEFTSAGIAVLGIDNAVNNRFDWDQRRYITSAKYQQLRRYTVLPGDIIITIMGTCGRCAIIPKNIPTAINTKHLCCLTLDREKALPSFIHAAFLYHPLIRHQLAVAEKGAIMEGLNMTIIKELALPLLPIALQEKFADIAERHQRLRATHVEALRQADHLFQSLLHQAFSV
jgi:type I restriction enzyme S subunit